MTFHATNLTAGTSWQVEFNGTLYGSDSPWINVSTHPGQFDVQALPVPPSNTSAGFVPVSPALWMSVAPGRTYSIGYDAGTFNASSSLRAATPRTPWQEWVVPGNQITLAAHTAEPGYGWAGWDGSGTGSYSGSASTPTIQVTAPIFESADLYLLPPGSSNLTVVAHGLPNGTIWEISLGGTSIQSSNDTLVAHGLDACGVAGLAGGYRLQVPVATGDNTTNATRFVPLSYPSIVCPDSPKPIVTSFATQYYLALSSSGSGSATATSGRGGILGGSAWFTAETPLALQATALNGTEFAGWVGMGPGSYTGPLLGTSITPSGSISERATFVAGTASLPPATQLTFTLRSPCPPGCRGGSPWEGRRSPP